MDRTERNDVDAFGVECLSRLRESLIVADGVVVGVEIGVVDGEAQGGCAVAAYGVGAYDGVGVVGGGEQSAMPEETIAGGKDVVVGAAGFYFQVHGETAVGAAMGGNDGVFDGGFGEGYTVPDVRGLGVADGVENSCVGIAADNHCVVDKAVAFPTVGQSEDAVGHIVGKRGVVVGVRQVVFGYYLGKVGDVDGADGGEDFGYRVAEVYGLPYIATLTEYLAGSQSVLNRIADGVVNGYLAIFEILTNDAYGAVGALVCLDYKTGGVLVAEGVAYAVDYECCGFSATDGETDGGVVVSCHMEREMQKTVATENVGEDEEGVDNIAVESDIVELIVGKVVFYDGSVDIVI